MSVRRTKIVATLGPASDTKESIARLIDAGMNVARVNFSHGSHADHARRIAAVREAAAESGRSVGVLQDLQGPKIRTGGLAGGEPVELVEGAEFTITTRAVEGSAQLVSTTYAALPHDVRAGDRILLSDGSIHLSVTATSDTDVTTEVEYGGLLRERQGVNLPGVDVSIESVTEKDVADLEFGLSQAVDYVAISFVRSADDVHRVRKLIAARGHEIPLIAKLEKPEALDALPAILDASDAVMVARGDLGVELAPEKVPLAQKEIIAAANERAKPVITATQMLESMIHNPRPTRAEASDVANAILDGSDAIMLSGETAMGAYPVEAIATMVRIAEEIRTGNPRHVRLQRLALEIEAARSSPEAIAVAVESVVDALTEISAVWVFTQSGATARLIARQRPDVPIIAFTPNEACCRRLSLVWGVTPVLTPVVSTFRELAKRVFPLARRLGLAVPGDTVVMTGSHPFDAAAPTNFLKLHVVAGP